MDWLTPRPYHTLVLLVALGMMSAAFAWITFDLVRLAMANADFLQREGLAAVMYGGLWQTLVIAGKGMAALALYLGFKGVEREVVTRWLDRD